MYDMDQVESLFHGFLMKGHSGEYAGSLLFLVDQAAPEYQIVKESYNCVDLDYLLESASNYLLQTFGDDQLLDYGSLDAAWSSFMAGMPELRITDSRNQRTVDRGDTNGEFTRFVQSEMSPPTERLRSAMSKKAMSL